MHLLFFLLQDKRSARGIPVQIPWYELPEITREGQCKVSWSFPHLIFTRALRIIVWWWFSRITWLKKSLVQERGVSEEETLLWGCFLAQSDSFPGSETFCGERGTKQIDAASPVDLAQVDVLWASGNCPTHQHCPGGPRHSGEQDLGELSSAAHLAWPEPWCGSL